MTKNNKGFLLISSVFLVLFLGLTISVSLIRSDIQLRAMDLRRASSSAFYAAEAGIERAVFELSRDQDWRVGFPSDPDQEREPLVWAGVEEGEEETVGSYNVRVAGGVPVGNLDTVWLLSRGQDQEERVSRFILARVEVQNPATYFTSTIGELTIRGGTTINGSILGRDIIFVASQDSPIAVSGDVEYIRNIEGYPNDNVIITGGTDDLPNPRQRPPFTFVSIDLDRYRTLAQENGRYINGDLTYSGEINWEDLETNNGLVFADGDIHIDGEVTQSIHFVAGEREDDDGKGNIYIEDDIDCASVDDVQTQIALSASGNVVVSEDAVDTIDIDAFIHADGGVFKADGDKFSKNELNFEGAIAVRGEEEEPAVDLNVYSVRHYTYDDALRNNLQIPFMSFSANIISWRDLDKGEYEQELEDKF